MTNLKFILQKNLGIDWKIKIMIYAFSATKRNMSFWKSKGINLQFLCLCDYQIALLTQIFILDLRVMPPSIPTLYDLGTLLPDLFFIPLGT